MQNVAVPPATVYGVRTTAVMIVYTVSRKGSYLPLLLSTSIGHFVVLLNIFTSTNKGVWLVAHRMAEG